MKRPWQAIDLEGGGLQSLNSELARRQRRPTRAYTLWLLFPLGLHRFYLDSPRGALGQLALTLIALFSGLLVHPAGFAALALVALWGVVDLFWIPRRLPEVNKQERIDLFMSAGAAPPPGYRGRYPDEADPEALLSDYAATKERERAGHQPANQGPEPGGRFPSFAEQERLLKEMNRNDTD